jgi:hypothetical protein
LISAFCGTYSEFIMKTGDDNENLKSKFEHFLIRQLQLSCMAFVTLSWNINFDIKLSVDLAIITVITSLQGLGAGLTLFYADNVAKCYATIISTWLVSIINVYLFAENPPSFIVIGMINVLFAALLY